MLQNGKNGRMAMYVAKYYKVQLKINILVQQSRIQHKYDNLLIEHNELLNEIALVKGLFDRADKRVVQSMATCQQVGFKVRYENKCIFESYLTMQGVAMNILYRHVQKNIQYYSCFSNPHYTIY
jgi:hypothetical protein